MSDTFKRYISNVEDFSWHLYEKDVIALFQDVSVPTFYCAQKYIRFSVFSGVSLPTF